VNSSFHETRIPTVDRKVQVWTKFRIYFFWKKVKSPLSMNFGRISTSKCRVLYTHSLKSPGPFPKLLKNLFFLNKKISKNWVQLVGLYPFFLIFFFHALHFIRKWSTLSHWLQYMPTLPRLLLETSSIHNF
jgi:hypothetical protein